MNSEDLDVLEHCCHWVEQEWHVLLVTVVKTWGSSPRPEGAMLAIRADGRVVGSVSGGCIEDDLIYQVKQADFRLTRPRLVEYGVSADEARRFGLPCGGTIRLMLEPLNRYSGIDRLLAAVKEHRVVARHLNVDTGFATLEDTPTAAGVALRGRTLTTVHGPRHRMLVIGAGQLSSYLCRIALGLDYQVTVCDPRSDYADHWDVPRVRLTRDMPDDVVIQMKLDARCAVVTLTHDPKLDDLALMEALRTPAFYVGAIGSRKNNAARRQRLLEFDLTEQDVARLHGPAGLYIGSKTPPEIALSILAEITAIRNGVQAGQVLAVEQGKNGQAGEFLPASCTV
ncbi:hypothetical protein GHR37_00890 [Achromobacter xylosoxidans]|nr:hypothetical protein [Achromobacter xylosoxidans]